MSAIGIVLSVGVLLVIGAAWFVRREFRQWAAGSIPVATEAEYDAQFSEDQNWRVSVPVPKESEVCSRPADMSGAAFQRHSCYPAPFDDTWAGITPEPASQKIKTCLRPAGMSEAVLRRPSYGTRNPAELN